MTLPQSLPSWEIMLLRSLPLLLGALLLTLGACAERTSSPPPPPASPTPYPVPSPSVSAPARQEAANLRQAGLEQRNQGNLAGAIATFQQAVEQDPENLSGYVLLGWTQHLAEQRSVAKDSLLKALDRNPNYIPALNALGIVYLVDGDLQAAVETHTRAATLETGNEIAHYNLSLAYQRLGQFEEAIAQATTATELEPGNPHPWVALAIAHQSQGNVAEAQQAYQQAIQLNRRYRDAAYLAHLAQAGFSPDQIQLTEALRTSL